MTGQMCWMGVDSDSPKLLYLRKSTTEAWRPYHACPECVPDYLIRGGSKGFATMQVLLKQGWELVSSQQGEESVKELVESGWR